MKGLILAMKFDENTRITKIKGKDNCLEVLKYVAKRTNLKLNLEDLKYWSNIRFTAHDGNNYILTASANISLVIGFPKYKVTGYETIGDVISFYNNLILKEKIYEMNIKKSWIDSIFK